MLRKTHKRLEDVNTYGDKMFYYIIFCMVLIAMSIFLLALGCYITTKILLWFIL